MNSNSERVRLSQRSTTEWFKNILSNSSGLTRPRYLCAGLAAAISSFGTTSAYAQDTAAGEPQVDEIIVTGSKRGDLNLQNTPVTISAFSSATLEERGMAGLNDIAQYTPGLNIDDSGVPGESQVIIRGVTLGGVSRASPRVRATTGIYINDVSFELNGANPDLELYDLERVEVLKGPQGSLFGSSAMAGAIRYITKRPELNEVSGQVVGNISSTRHGDMSYTLKGVVNLPVGDSVAVRVMGYRNDEGGFVDNRITEQDDVNTYENYGGRVSALFQPTDNFSANLMVQYQKSETRGSSGVQGSSSTIIDELLVSNPDLFPDGFEQPTDPEQFATGTNLGDGLTKDETLASTLELNLDLGWGTLTSVTGYVNRKANSNVPSNELEFIYQQYGVLLTNGIFAFEHDIDKISEELRLTANLGKIGRITAGVYYSHGELRLDGSQGAEGWDQWLFDSPTLPDPFSPDGTQPNPGYQVPPSVWGCAPEFQDHLYCGYEQTIEKQIAGFGEVDIFLTDKLTLTAGGRYFHYDQDFSFRYEGYFNFGLSENQRIFKESGFNPKFGLSYQATDDVLLYASAAKGFRQGGVDDPIPANVCDEELEGIDLGDDYTGVFKSDSLWTYEAGAKTRLFDNRVTLNGAAFYTKWKDIQTNETLFPCGYAVTVNASRQDIKGIELETSVAVTDNLTLSANGSYTDAKLKGDAIIGNDGDRAPNVPRYTLNGIVDFSQPLTDSLDAFVFLAMNYQSDFTTAYTNATTIDSRVTGDIRFGVQSDRFRATAFIDNFTDELVLLGSLLGRGDTRLFTVGRPRTIGLELQFDF